MHSTTEQKFSSNSNFEPIPITIISQAPEIKISTNINKLQSWLESKRASQNSLQYFNFFLARMLNEIINHSSELKQINSKRWSMANGPYIRDRFRKIKQRLINNDSECQSQSSLV